MQQNSRVYVAAAIVVILMIAGITQLMQWAKSRAKEIAPPPVVIEQPIEQPKGWFDSFKENLPFGKKDDIVEPPVAASPAKKGILDTIRDALPSLPSAPPTPSETKPNRRPSWQYDSGAVPGCSFDEKGNLISCNDSP